MRTILEAKLKGITSPERRRDILREFLQHLILSSLDRRGAFQHWAFVGGTSLRVLFDLRRFSEDLDFSAIRGSKKKAHVKKVMADVAKDLADWGFACTVAHVKDGIVESGFFEFPGLLKDFGITKDPRQKLSIKCEVDQNPPTGFHLQTSAVQKDFLMMIVHHDLPSLFAGKLHAFLCRRFVKGRDLYDLVWYLTRKTPVNLEFLQNAIRQTGSTPPNSLTTLTETLKIKIESLDLRSVKNDLAPFLEDPSEIRFIERDSLSSLLRNIAP